jgi:hypothetical protein
MRNNLVAEEGLCLEDGEQYRMQCVRCAKRLFPRLEANPPMEWVQWQARCCGQFYTLIPLAWEVQIHQAEVPLDGD